MPRRARHQPLHHLHGRRYRAGDVYAQHLSTIGRLTTDNVGTQGDSVAPGLGTAPIVLPEPVDDRRPGTLIDAPNAPLWSFPSRRLDDLRRRHRPPYLRRSVTGNSTNKQVRDPFGTLRRVLWISGGQWAGKSTVTRLPALRYGLTVYQYDYHDARGHNDRRIARRVKLGQPPADPDPERAQRNRLERDRLVADDAVRSARRLGIRVIEVDGSRDAAAIADIVADHFSPYLPPPEDHSA